MEENGSQTTLQKHLKSKSFASSQQISVNRETQFSKASNSGVLEEKFRRNS
jgi:hypothetical protein